MKQLIFLTYEKRELKQRNNKKGYDIAAIALYLMRNYIFIL